MSSVVGIDLSTKALDLVKLNEEGVVAEWRRVDLEGADAWERTLDVRWKMRDSQLYDWTNGGGYWDDVYLVAIEEPFSRAKGKSLLMLNRVVGAVMASLPHDLRSPHRCWLVAPHEWKAGLGLKGKPSMDEVRAVAPGASIRQRRPALVLPDAELQNARDAYCLALWARDTNAKAATAA